MSTSSLSFFIGFNDSSVFYPVPDETERTTLREIQFGVHCWFTFQFMEIFPYNESLNDWIEVSSTDSLMLFINGRLEWSSMG